MTPSTNNGTAAVSYIGGDPRQTPEGDGTRVMRARAPHGTPDVAGAHLARALLAALDDGALDELAQLLAPRLTALQGEDRGGYLAPAEAARYLGVTRKRIYDLKSARSIEPDGFDGRVPLFSRATLDAYVREGLTRR